MESILTRLIVSGITAAVGYQVYNTIVDLYSSAFAAISFIQ